ncbi:uncharacterized protein LOC144987841 [Oryzias latipes]
MAEQAYAFCATQDNSSSFPSAPLPQTSSSFPSPHAPDSSDTSGPQNSLNYPPLSLSSGPDHPNTPALQQTSFNFPTPPLSDSASSPLPLVSSSSTPSSTNYHIMPEAVSPQTPASFPAPPASCQSNLQICNNSQPHQFYLGEAVFHGDNPPSDQTSTAFTYPNVPPTNPDPPSAVTQPLIHQPPSLPCSHSALSSCSYPSIPPQMQTLPYPSLSPSPTLHLPNLTHQASSNSHTSTFPPCSFTHASSSLPPPSFQAASCLVRSSSFQPSACAAGAYPQSLPHPSASSSTCSYPPGVIAHPPPLTYRPEVVLHHPASLSSPTPPPTLYTAFPSYPLRLDPHSSLSIPFRPLYR